MRWRKLLAVLALAVLVAALAATTRLFVRRALESANRRLLEAPPAPLSDGMPLAAWQERFGRPDSVISTDKYQVLRYGRQRLRAVFERHTDKYEQWRLMACFDDDEALWRIADRPGEFDRFPCEQIALSTVAARMAK
jgi:hypothetical protein